MKVMNLPEFVNKFDPEQRLKDPIPGQRVIVASFDGRVVWALGKTRISEEEITAVKRKYIYVGKGRNQTAFDKDTLIEHRTDGYSPDKCLFPSMDALNAATEYVQLAEMLFERLKLVRSLDGNLPSLPALRRAEAELTVPLGPAPAANKGSSTDPDTSTIFDIIEGAVARAGYTVLDGDGNAVYVRDKEKEQDYEIKVQPAG